ncbi:17590_t:CDS:1, partial [Cetraspora pellucida]
TDLDFSILMANYVASLTPKNATSKSKRDLSFKSKWINQVFEKLKLEVYDNTNDVLSNFLIQTHKILLSKSSYDHKLKAI